MRNLARHVQKRSPLTRHIWRKERADVKLINHEIFESRRSVSGLMPRKVRRANDTFTRKGCSELTSVRVPFRTLAALPNHVETVTMAIADARNETAPMSAVVARQKTRVVSGPIVEGPDDVDGLSVRRPYAEHRAVGDQRRTHRRVAVNV